MKKISHNGVLFTDEYKPILRFLKPLAEEMLYNYALKEKTLEELKKKDKKLYNQFNNNFWSCLKFELTTEQKKFKFPDDFKNTLQQLKDYNEKLKEEKKNNKKTVDDKFKYALVNDIPEPLMNVMIEPPGIFIGRGDNHLTGMWKYRVQPEDITINVLKSPVPEPPTGHKWGNVINKPVNYIASYYIKIGRDEQGNPIFQDRKEIRFDSKSSIIHSSDVKKFKKAQELLKNWDNIQNLIIKNLKNTNQTIRECALISWLVQFTSIRIGTETEVSEFNGVVGASTLRCKNIKFVNDKQNINSKVKSFLETYLNFHTVLFCKIHYDNTNDKNDVRTININLDEYETIILNFIGKDSINYVQKFLIPKSVSDALKIQMKGKKPDDKIFNVKSDDVNDFLNSLLEGLTAKVFRTAWAEKIIEQEIKGYKVFKNGTNKENVNYNILQVKNILLKVSLYLNHKKEPTDKSNVIDKIKEKIENAKTANEKKILKLKLEYTIESNGVNTSTALTNYINPKCVKKLCNKFEIPIDKIYSKTLLIRFKDFIN